MDAFANRSDSQNKENPLQAIVDSLTAKNLELEAKLAHMTDRAIIYEAELV